MGLFSSKKKVFVGASASRVIEDDALPDFTQTAAIQSVLRNTSLVDELIDGVQETMVMKVNAMASYARSSYPFGSPSGDRHSAASGEDEIRVTLEALEGQPIAMEYWSRGPLNILHVGWLALVQEHGYDPETNEVRGLSEEKGNKVYLQDLVVVLPAGQERAYSPASLAQWGTPASSGVTPSRPAQALTPGLGSIAIHSPIQSRPGLEEDFAEATCVWQVPGAASVSSTTVALSNAHYDQNGDYVHVRYTVGGATKFWIYAVGSGGFPDLDAALSSGSSLAGDFMPMVHFRVDGASVGANKTSAKYKASVKMARMMGLDYQTLLEAIEENEGINDVRHAFLGMSVPAVTTNQVELQYLFDFFSYLHTDNQISGSPLVNARDIREAAQAAISNKHAITIQDTATQTVLTMGGIYKRRKVGNIGDVGSHSSSLESIPGESVKWANTSYTTSPYTVHIYRRQITPNLYDEVQVLALAMSYKVAEGQHLAVGEGESPVLLIPLDRALTREYTLRDREILYARSLHIICVSMQVVKVKWYQQTWFSVVLKIAAIAMLISSLGKAYQMATTAWAAATTAAAAAIAVIQVIVVYIVQTLAISYALRRVAQAAGVEATVILALVAAMYGGAKWFQAGSLAATPLAEQLLMLSTGLVKAATEKQALDTQELLGELSTEREKYLKDMELLGSRQDMLEQRLLFNPLVIFGESPDVYFTRTVHTGNIGTIGVEAIHTYFDQAVSLPDVAHTLGAVTDE